MNGYGRGVKINSIPHIFKYADQFRGNVCTLYCGLLSSVTTVPGAIIAYFFMRTTQAAVPYILALSAAGFIYIALADLIPTLHRKSGIGASIRQVILLLAGVGTILIIKLFQG